MKSVSHALAPPSAHANPERQPVGRERPAPLGRREFLAGSAVLTGTIAAGSILATAAPSRVWAAEMTVLDERQAKFLLRLTQVIFPHRQMPDAINALAVKDLDKAAADPAVARAFADGIAAFDQAAGGDWLAATPEQQLAVVKAQTATPMFIKVRGSCITSLYDNELAYRHFGYEGEAFGKGGYLTRGFNDLTWLPDPPATASPAPFL